MLGLAQMGGSAMTLAASDGRSVVLSFVEHEHSELEQELGRIYELAADAPFLPASELSSRVAGVLGWVERSLRPHLAWEEAWLLPQIADRAETPLVSHLARIDHAQIDRRAEHLAIIRTELLRAGSRHVATEVARELAALEALVRASFEREERILLPLLEPGDPWLPEWRD
jgi:iron-sulfur cluster repair protein YtfE (RIC family)